MGEGRLVRYTVALVDLEPTLGFEIAKVRPCVVISPVELHRFVRTVIIAPMTSTTKGYPFRVPCERRGVVGEIALDQLRAVDRQRIRQIFEPLDPANSRRVAETLVTLFAPIREVVRSG